MIQEAATRHYSAVLCRTCREPIPVPAIVISLSRDEKSEAGAPERVFTLRCRACESESPYRSGQIIEVEGEPKSRRFSGNPLNSHSRLSRAANA